MRLLTQWRHRSCKAGRDEAGLSGLLEVQEEAWDTVAAASLDSAAAAMDRTNKLVHDITGVSRQRDIEHEHQGLIVIRVWVPIWVVTLMSFRKTHNVLDLKALL